MLLENKVALITGGSGGIGRATAKLFLEHGARVLLADLKDEDLKEAADELGHADRVKTVKADVTRDADNRKMVEAAKEHFGGLDLFFANAGIEGDVAPITDYEERTYDAVMDVNVKGVFLGLKHALPAINEGGSIVITSSVAGLRGDPQMSAYTASKHAVVGLMRVAAKEAAERNVRVNCVNPGPVDNRMMEALEAAMGGEGVREDFVATIPLGRYAESEDIAGAVLFLASDLSRYVTGTVNPVDGGLTA